MTPSKNINLISVLLVLAAIVMIVLGIAIKIPAPFLTGPSFILIVWASQVFK